MSHVEGMHVTCGWHACHMWMACMSHVDGMHVTCGGHVISCTSHGKLTT